MPELWTAVDSATEPLSRARQIRRVYDQTVSGSEQPEGLRSLVRASWSRSEAMGVDPKRLPSVVLTPAAARRRLLHHPCGRLVHLLDGIVAVARNAGQVLTIADAEGVLLWTGGDEDMLAAAHGAHRRPGGLWSEQEAGTNALGTALALDHPVQIFSAEHFKRCLHRWSSSAAPVHDPDTGNALGVVDVWGPFQWAHPHGLSFVVAAAGMLDAHLAHEAAERDERIKVEYLERLVEGESTPSAVVNSSGRVLLSTPSGWLRTQLPLSPEGTPILPEPEKMALEPLCKGEGYLVREARGRRAPRTMLRLRALGRSRAAVLLDGWEFNLTPRHSEIVVILALRPEGLTDEELAMALYPSPTDAVTIRAEVSRLRKLLGPNVIQTQPYRLNATVRADFLDVERLVAQGKLDVAARRYHDPLLPTSSSPNVVAAREQLDAALQRPMNANT